MTDLKVQKGDKIIAESWNRLVDLAGGSTFGGSAATRNLSQVKVEIVNDSGRDYDIGEIFYITSYDGATGNAPYEAAEGPIFSGIEPVWHTSISRLAVAADPIPDGEQGIAVVSGLCVFKASTDGTDDWLMIDQTTEYQCEVAKGGIAKIIGKIANGWYLGLLGQTQTLWRYELEEDSQAPSDTDAKLLDVAGSDYATAIDLSDPDSLMDDQVDTDQGWCIQVGNKFYAIQAVCA